MFVLQGAGDSQPRPRQAGTESAEDLLARTEREISRKLFDIETIDCLRTGFRLEDRSQYLSFLELRRRTHRASLGLQTTRMLEQEVEEVTKRLEQNIMLEEKVLLSVREVQNETVEYFLSRISG